MPLVYKEREGGSGYTYRDLMDLNSKEKAWKSPLSCICHIDMNAFFAQCEQIRLGLLPEDPVVCVQWSTIIAVSYSAREYGINRMDKLEEAKLKCPSLIAAHTAVFKRGQPVWKYTDYLPSPLDHKVSLDPYRRESRKIMKLLQENCDLTEKASVDECFLDLGRLVFEQIKTMFPSLLDNIENFNDKLPNLPVLPLKLQFKGYIVNKTAEKDLETQSSDGDTGEFLVEDWDDLVILIGSNICYDLRMKIKEQLGYFTSGGVGRVKTIAKLASDFKKPDQQTIVRNDSIANFLVNFDLTDFWSMGGKIGKYVKSRLGDEDVIKKLRTEFDSPQDLYEVLDNDKDLCERLFNIVRGELRAPLEPKAMLKSMGANKNFRGKAVSDYKSLKPWLEVFIGELVLRLQELDEELDSVIRPTKLTLGARNRIHVSHTKQCTINANVKDYGQLHILFHENALKLVSEMEKIRELENNSVNMYPMTHASLSISGLKEVNNVNTLDDLLSNVKKRIKTSPSVEEPKAVKRGVLDNIFQKKNNSNHDLGEILANNPEEDKKRNPTINEKEMHEEYCGKCNEKIAIEERISHQDFHFALELDSKLNKDFDEGLADEFLRKKKRKFLKGQSTLPFTSK